MSENQEHKNMEEGKNGWSVFRLCKAFFGIYFSFSLVFGFLSILLFNGFSELALFRDSTLIIAILLYVTLISMLFAYLGATYANRIFGNIRKQIIIVLPVTILGVLLWYASFQFSRNIIISDFGGVSWSVYSIFILWAMPVFESFKIYFTNNNILVYMGILPSILPGLSFLGGIWVAKYLDWNKSKKRIITGAAIIPTILVIVLMLSAVVPNSSTVFTKDSYPKVDGATAAIPFAEGLVKELTGVSVKKSQSLVYFNKSHGAYVNLINKEADIIFVAGPSDDALELAKEKNVSFDLTPIAKDAFIFLVHENNPIDNLSIEQVQDIYLGKIINWRDIGGQDNEITAYQRNRNSGSQTFMETQIMEGKKLSDAPTTQKIGGMGGLVDTVAEYENARNSIGYSFYYFANEMHKNESVKFLAIDGVEVNKENIISDRYPFTATLYAVAREDEPERSEANQLLSWILSEEGSHAIEKGGFVPIN